MLRCLIRLSSAARSSPRLIVLPSRTLATIRTYGKMREVTRVGSSSTKPSRCNVRCCNIAGDVSTDGDSSTVAASEISALGESAVSWLACSSGVGDAVSLGAAWSALLRAAVLSFFLFALPLSVWLCFLLRALPSWR
jgi:hypothetical protein